ncbi:hypothetical protein [Billgrantia antri]|uniref:Uncharacterized protein n=1 Tax=Billgrantia antri TaxID=2846777 RepID=A0ABS6ZT80_9GAMM|nr:hypothetical protein [Halomonas antri]MBW6393038.1 hypothetical protein [Halomonas antri]
MARMRKRVLRCLHWGGALLGAAWLTGASAQETEPDSASPAVPGRGAATPDPAETTPPPDVTTGQYGTSSGITNSDMLIREEDSGSGQAQGDNLFQTPAAGSEAGPDHDVQTPETDTDADQRAGAEQPRTSQANDNSANGQPQSSNADQGRDNGSSDQNR